MTQSNEHTTERLDTRGLEDLRQTAASQLIPTEADRALPIAAEIGKKVADAVVHIETFPHRGIAPRTVAFFSGLGMIISFATVWHLTEPDQAPQPSIASQIPSTELTADPVETSFVDAGSPLQTSKKKASKAITPSPAQPSASPSSNESIWGDSIGDSFGAGDLGLSGIGEGPGRPAHRTQTPRMPTVPSSTAQTNTAKKK